MNLEELISKPRELKEELITIANYVINNMGQPIDYFSNKEIAEKVNQKITRLKDIFSIIKFQPENKDNITTALYETTSKKIDKEIFKREMEGITKIPYYGDLILSNNMIVNGYSLINQKMTTLKILLEQENEEPAEIEDSLITTIDYIINNMGQPIDYFNNRRIAENINPRVGKLRKNLITLLLNKRLLKGIYKQITNEDINDENIKSFSEILSNYSLTFYGDIITSQNRKIKQGLYTNMKDKLRILKILLTNPKVIRKIKNQTKINYI